MTGIFGMFTNPLAGQLGWLLPVGLAALLVLLVPLVPERVFRKPIEWFDHARGSDGAAQTILWGGWLLTAVVVFALADATTTHPYYLVGVAVPLAAVLGAGLAGAFRERVALVWLLVAAAMGTVLYQAFMARGIVGDWTIAVALVAAFFGFFVMALGITKRLAETHLVKGAAAVCGLALLVVPLLYGVGLNGMVMGPKAAMLPPPTQQVVPQKRPDIVITFVKSDGGEGAVIATMNAREAAPFIIAGVPAVAVGGFSGNDPIFTGDSFRKLAEERKVRYFLMPEAQGVLPGGQRPQERVINYVRNVWEDVSRLAGLPSGVLYRFRQP
jgi:hypothetical protein